MMKSEQTAIHDITDSERREAAFDLLTPDERQLLTCALAGNHPPRLAYLRVPILRSLAVVDQTTEQ